ncbi:MAG: alpha-amylase family glycosyl hydrolase [Planctomycetota bacterium]|jgi:glycosidase
MWPSTLLLALTALHSMSQSTPDLAGATLYEVNVRQFSAEGDFAGVTRQLPRLADLGVDVLWLMPIHPIGEERRKGSLGSYYAATDHRAVNPEYGSEEDFRQLVAEAHAAGMRVVLDWVANHTAWDHVWTESHPERFRRGSDGGFVPPNADWTDVIDLDYANPDTCRAMTDAMAYWIDEFDVDGFRCDVAELVPEAFWSAAIAELRERKPLFMLAEGQDSWLYDVGFDATYGWRVAERVLEVAQGTGEPSALLEELEREREFHAEHPGKYRIHFTSNHDWNSWHGLAVERLGPAWEAATVLTFTLPGMPLIYGGQEAGLEHRLEFFERDPIRWRPHPSAALFRSLTGLKGRAAPLVHGAARDWDGLTWLEDLPDGVLGFERRRGGELVRILVNLTPEPADLDALEPVGAGAVDVHGFPTESPERLEPWGWHVACLR